MKQRRVWQPWASSMAAAVAALVAAGAGCDRGEPAAGASRPSQATAAPSAVAARTSAAEPSPREPRFGSAEPTARPAGALRIATYNVENLFDDKDDPALSGDNEDIDDTKPAAHVEAAAAAIRRIDADIIALQEIESEEVVRAFRDAHLSGLGYEHLASIDAGDERGIEQAVLSRYPIVEVKNWPRLPLGGVHPEKWGDAENFNAGQPIVFHRSPLRVTVQVPAEEGRPEPYDVTLFVVHQKSGRDGDYWRRAEAAKTVELAADLTREDPDRNILIAGDFNAVFWDGPMQAFRDAGFTDAFDIGRTPGPEYISHASGRRIDYILLSPAAAREFITETRFVLGTPMRPEGADWRTTEPPTGYASDHCPVVVDLTPVDR